jgi:shikimate kinase
MERSEIVLIGPVRTGKSTLGRLLAERLFVPQVSLDEVRLKYYADAIGNLIAYNIVLFYLLVLSG